MEKSKIIETLEDRLAAIEKWKKTTSEDLDKDKHKGKADEEVCPNCGGDLLFVEDGIVYCPKCKDYFEEEK